MATRKELDSLEIDDRPLMSPVCTYCVHWRSEKFATIRTCDAFPAGIPDEIWMGENDHRQPFQGDHGLRFEPAPPE